MRFLLFLVFIIPAFLFSQENKGRIYGTVEAENNKEKLAYCTVFIKELNISAQTNEKGKYAFESVPYGNYTLVFHIIGHDQLEKKINLQQTELKVNSSLVVKSEQLESYTVEAEKEGVGNVSRMRSIEGVLISQGKKNEVIQVSDINANKSTNQGRQIYSRIPGLNIWESDGAGIQLGIGGRGLNPSRTSNFNTRQNGYDISADALGYPESYYTPPSEAVKKIQLIRGAASLQFGTQFGGLLNFVLFDEPQDPNKEYEVTVRQTLGSFALNNTFMSVGFKKDTWKGYGYFQHKKGNDWRPNSNFQVYSGGINIGKYINEKAFVGAEFTKMYYLAHQPGGLTDKEFYADPYQSKRERNWFEVDWNLASVHFNYDFTAQTRLKTQFFGLLASRKALGVLGNISRPDNTSENRNLITGEFKNYGNETRFLHIYNVGENPWAFLIGTRFYKGYNQSQQGDADTTNLPNFTFNADNITGSTYEFPSTNISVFTENIFRIGKKFSITPGIRFESITTNANGNYKDVIYDLAGNVVFDTTLYENRTNQRAFVIAGVGLNYRFNEMVDIYSNFSQNYRSINFTDMQIQNKNFRIDPDLQDETGFNFDLGVRGSIKNKLNYDVSGYALLYDNRIGDVDQVDEKTYIPYRYRTNVSKALIQGVEAMVEVDWWKTIFSDSSKVSFRTFVNSSYTNAKYIDSQSAAFEDKLVEFVPAFNLKTGATFAYQRISITHQYSYVSEQFTDATNAGKDNNGNVIFIPNAIIGIIPSYAVMDLSLKYDWNRISFETGVNNLTNEFYFTRRATGYPGPGIIPSTIRNYYFTIQLKI